MEEIGYAHLFLYTPDGQPALRLTEGNADDAAPALSPDGTRLAFASNRSGYWDIYLLTLTTGETLQLTKTPAYDSAPSWSPDSQWLAFETYDGNDLEISVLSLADPTQPAVPLTDDPAADYSPAWSPGGREIAFISDRAGNPDVWLANLDLPDEGRYTNLSATPKAAEHCPLWSASRLLWTSEAEDLGFSGAYIWNRNEPERPARWVTDADYATWDPSSTRLAVTLNGPNADYLSASSLTGGLLLPPQPLPGPVRGLAWLTLDLPNPLPEAYNRATAYTPVAPWSPAFVPVDEGPANRWTVVPLPDVLAPYPQLHDLVDESFAALRARVIAEAGWDALASLQNAFVPLTSPLDPGLGNDWLHTGRAFAINTLIANTGWMVTVREEIGQQTFWRVYLRAQMQDGSQGEPLRDAPWDLSARYNLDPLAYERGGQYAPIPTGYWVDFTSLARAYGWERLPSLPNWRAYYAGTRFSEFALTSGLEWYDAMLELYPAEALITPTPRLPPTPTPSRTPKPTLTSGPSPTPTTSPTVTPSPLPTSTSTPVPSNTPLP
jgi:TolB protein